MLISAEGVEGDWTPWKFTHGNTSIFEVWIRSERYSGSGDDTATNGLRFKDSNHKTYEPYVGYWNKDDYCDSTTGGHWVENRVEFQCDYDPTYISGLIFTTLIHFDFDCKIYIWNLTF